MSNKEIQEAKKVLEQISEDEYKCQYMNEQKIKNKNVQKCELCN